MAAGREQWNTSNFLADILVKDVPIPYPELEAIIRKSGVQRGMDRSTVLKYLKLHEEDLLGWVYRHIAQRCADIGIQPVWIYLPPLSQTKGEAEERGRARSLAEDAGFEIVDLTGIYDREDVEALSLADWDKHPNAKAHQLIANRLYTAIQTNPGTFKLPPL